MCLLKKVPALFPMLCLPTGKYICYLTQKVVLKDHTKKVNGMSYVANLLGPCGLPIIHLLTRSPQVGMFV